MTLVKVTVKEIPIPTRIKDHDDDHDEDNDGDESCEDHFLSEEKVADNKEGGDIDGKK